MAKRGQVKLNITAETDAVIERMCGRYGMTKQEMASRIYQWFAEQDEIVQASVLDLLPESVETEAADIYMERVKAKRSSGVKGSVKRGPK